MIRHGFRIQKKQFLPELQATLIEGVHEKTGAQFMHIETDDAENLFCLSFRTYPSDDKGVAHILEHTVLCGSEKFPIKDPFFAMTRRSLNTFMNALTGADFTCYPAASQIEKDFYNLFEIYIDAVFHPLLNRLSFLQEGHRFEFLENNGLVHKGVVFNEMKGALSSVDSRMWEAIFRHLLPDTPYRFNSGGDPKAIVQLTYEELVDFHQAFYSPSRCLFFTYGNIPLEKHLAFIAKHALKDVGKAPPLPLIPQQKRFKSPLSKEEPYPATDPDDVTGMFVLGWLTTPIEDQKTVLALSILDSVLMDTDASLLRRPLLDSKLCSSVSALQDLEMREVPYLILCRGIVPGAETKLEALILQTLTAIAKEGIDPKLSKTALHQLELSRLEITGGGIPFGLTLFMRSALLKQHGCPPEAGLALYSFFETLQQEVQDPFYLTRFINTWLVNNPHRVSLTLRPDPELLAKEEMEEKRALVEFEKQLSEEQKTQIRQDAKALETLRETQEYQSLDCLPKIHLTDIPDQVKNYPLSRQSHGQRLTLYHHNAFTNHILYATCALELADLKQEELAPAHLFLSLLPELGLAGRPFTENLLHLQQYTGGIALSFNFLPLYGKRGAFAAQLQLKGKALSRNVEPFFSILHEILEGKSDTNDGARIKELVLQKATYLKHRLTSRALNYATSLALAPLSPLNTLNEILQGLSYYRYIQDLATNIDARLPLLQETFKALQFTLFHNHHVDLIVTCEDKVREHLEAHRCFHLPSLTPRSFKPFQANLSPLEIHSHVRLIPAQVAYTAQAFSTISLPSLDTIPLSLASVLFESQILHKKIREEGGAYGVGCQYQPLTGNFLMHAYRDPHILKTKKAFAVAIDTLARGKFKESHLEAAKIELIQHIDTPIPPGARALFTYHNLISEATEERRRAIRQNLLTTTKQQVQASVASHLASFAKEGIWIIFTGQELIDKDKPPLEVIEI